MIVTGVHDNLTLLKTTFFHSTQRCRERSSSGAPPMTHPSFFRSKNASTLLAPILTILGHPSLSFSAIAVSAIDEL